jgi:hypothetical protein
MGADKEGMTPELRRLLELEAGRRDPPDDFKDLVRLRLAADLRRQLALEQKPGLRRPLARSPKLWIGMGAAFALAGLGWWVSRPRPQHPEPQPQLEAAPPTPTVVAEPSTAPPAVEPPPTSPVSPLVSPTAATRKKRPETFPREPSIETSLARERQLIERARAELHAGRPADAQTALHVHEREFPNGVLLEERLGLQIEVLAAHGETAAARQRAVEFRSRFPGSPLQSAIDSALRQASP